MKFIPVHSWLVPPPLILGIIGHPVIRVFYHTLYASIFEMHGYPFPRWRSLILCGKSSFFLAGEIVIVIMMLQYVASECCWDWNFHRDIFIYFSYCKSLTPFCKPVKDCVQLLHLWLAKRKLESPWVKDRDFKGGATNFFFHY